jgi:hypothetical protein
MKYLKLYEDFNNEIDTKALLQDIIEMAYVIEDHGIILHYCVAQRFDDHDMDGRINFYEMGDSNNIEENIEDLQEYDDFPEKIWRYEIRFRTKNYKLVDEYLAKLEIHLENYLVEVKKCELTSDEYGIKVIYKRHMNDLDKSGDILPNH